MTPPRPTVVVGRDGSTVTVTVDHIVIGLEPAQALALATALQQAARGGGA